MADAPKTIEVGARVKIRPVGILWMFLSAALCVVIFVAGYSAAVVACGGCSA